MRNLPSGCNKFNTGNEIMGWTGHTSLHAHGPFSPLFHFLFHFLFAATWYTVLELIILCQQNILVHNHVDHPVVEEQRVFAVEDEVFRDMKQRHRARNWRAEPEENAEDAVFLESRDSCRALEEVVDPEIRPNYDAIVIPNHNFLVWQNPAQIGPGTTKKNFGH